MIEVATKWFGRNRQNSNQCRECWDRMTWSALLTSLNRPMNERRVCVWYLNRSKVLEAWRDNTLETVSELAKRKVIETYFQDDVENDSEVRISFWSSETAMPLKNVRLKRFGNNWGERRWFNFFQVTHQSSDGFHFQGCRRAWRWTRTWFSVGSSNHLLLGLGQICSGAGSADSTGPLSVVASSQTIHVLHSLVGVGRERIKADIQISRQLNCKIGALRNRVHQLPLGLVWK